MINYSALIIDDEIENIALLKLYLNKYFSQIDSIYSSVDLKEGADYLLDYRPNILFLDFSFAEDVNSFKLLEIHNFLNTQIVFMCTEEQILKKTPNLNNFSYIIKPIKVEEFINSVSKTIEMVAIEKIVSKSITNTSNSGIIAIPSINKIELI